jgi:hypothetical protein
VLDFENRKGDLKMLNIVEKDIMESRIKTVKAMHSVMVDMNNEDAYMAWIWEMPDCPMEEDFEWFAEDIDRYEELYNYFMKLVDRYKKDGLFMPSDLSVEFMNELGIEIEILK